MIVSDVLHEIELGTWKSVFLQIVRILESHSKSTLDKVDLRSAPTSPSLVFLLLTSVRYRAMPTFGRDTIRRFRSNVSEMKQLAARDYEDLLQVSFRLLPEIPPAR
jgi:hypothetical protein